MDARFWLIAEVIAEKQSLKLARASLKQDSFSLYLTKKIYSFCKHDSGTASQILQNPNRTLLAFSIHIQSHPYSLWSK